jgi:hypothetical protein
MKPGCGSIFSLVWTFEAGSVYGQMVLEMAYQYETVKHKATDVS